jgi:4'-phosphopantetheinyl transferase
MTPVRLPFQSPVPRRFPKLKPSDIHLWIAKRELISVAPDGVDWLPQDERTRVEKILATGERIRFLQARKFLRDLLGQYTGLPASEVVFKYNRNGKPSLKVGPRNLFFNMAHSRELILVAVSQEAFIGVDIEELRAFDDLMDLATSYFSKTEAGLLRRASPEQRIPLFFRFWTGKEACIKASGGMVSDTSLKRIAFPGVNSRSDIYIAKSRVYLRWFSPAPMHLAAVAFKNRAAKIQCRRWN